MNSFQLHGVDHLALVNGYYRGAVRVRTATVSPPAESFIKFTSEDANTGALNDRKARKKRKRQQYQQRQLQELVATGKFVPLDPSVIDMLSQAHRAALLGDEWKPAIVDGVDLVDISDELDSGQDVVDDWHANNGDKVSVIMHGEQVCVMPPRSHFLVGDVRITLAANAEAMGPFSFILMDPPWENKSVDRKRCYGTFHHEELAKLLIGELAGGAHEGSCVLAIWVTNRPKYMAYILEELLPLWRFTYHATWFWLKVCTNGDLVTPLTSLHRLPVEKLVVAVRAGSSEELTHVRSQLGSTPKVVVSVPLRHSWKPPPESFFDQETLSGANLELFARELRPRFVSAGNEPLKFQTRDHFNVAELHYRTRRMRLTPTCRRRRGNGALETWTDASDAADTPVVATPPHVAAVTLDEVSAGPTAAYHDGTTPSPELDRPVREASGAANTAVDGYIQSEFQPVETILVATELLQRLDRLQSQLDQAALQGREDPHLAHDYRAACAETIKQIPLLALSKDIDQRLWTSWQRELAALEGRLAATSSKASEEMKLLDSLYVALRNYSALIRGVKTTCRSKSLTTSEETVALLVHRLSLAQAHVMYALAVHSSQDEKDWRIPELYYEQARQYCVKQGETHYHLARIVLHGGRCFEALYHLVRSRTAASPFESPGSLAEQFLHLSSLRNSDAGQDVASNWLEFDRAMLEAVAPYFGQQQEFLVQRRMPHALSSALCTLLESITKSTPNSSSAAHENSKLAADPIRIARVVLLVIACGCLQTDLVHSTSVSAVEPAEFANVKQPRAVELVVSLVNGLLHRFLSTITNPLESLNQKESALQLMLPAINVAFGWLSTISWRDMVAESTRASCEQLSTMLLTGVIAGGFLAPHEEHTSSEAPPLPEELELIGFSCFGGIDSRSLEAKLSETDQDTATDGEVLQRRIMKFLSHVEAFMTPRPAAVAVIASATPPRPVSGSGDSVSQQLEQLSLNVGDSVSTGSSTPSTILQTSASASRLAASRKNEEAQSPGSGALDPGNPPKSVVERVVVLDAANIAMRHGLQRRFSCRGIQLCAEYFFAQGDRVVAFLPDYCLDVDADGCFRRRVAYSGGGGRARRREGRCTITPDDRVLLEILVDSGVVVLTPAMDSDDLYCIHYARRHNAFLVTNDLFRDHISETEGPKARQTELRNWLQARRISYTWVADEFLPNPNSAYEKMRLTAASTSSGGGA